MQKFPAAWPPGGHDGDRVRADRQRGFTLIELLMALALAVLLVAALNGVTGHVLSTHDSVSRSNTLNREARFALEQITRAVSNSPRLLLPLADNAATAQAENVRTLLAVTLDHATDLDGNGIPDADNDGDGRFDEDPPADWTFDAAAGIYRIDDDANGTVDGGDPASDDESASADEDPVNGVDDDSDGSIDEDPAADLNGDGCPGICGVDDDGDGVVDEGSGDNDDEDGSTDEDWLDPVVFRLSGTQLLMRLPVPWDESGDGQVSGLDFIESPVAEQVSEFRVERLPDVPGRTAQLDIVLALTDAGSGATVRLTTRVRVGGAL